MSQGVYQSPSGALFGFIVHEKTSLTFRLTVSGKEEFLRLLLDATLTQEQKSSIMKMIDEDFQQLLRKRAPVEPSPSTPRTKRKKS